MKIEAAQAKLGSGRDGGSSRTAAAGLVQQIDAAAAAQTQLKAAQQAANEAWRFGSTSVADGIEGLISAARAEPGVARSLSSFAQQGLSAAPDRVGLLRRPVRHAGTTGATGRPVRRARLVLFGADLRTTAGSPSFSGLYADGGTIGAGQWGIVGEKGAEVVAGPATVVPWAKIARPGGGHARSHAGHQFNVTTPDAPSFARSESADVGARCPAPSARGQRNA